MKETILGFLREYGDITFDEMGLSEADSLILCQLAYLKFDGMVPGFMEDKEGVTLYDLSVSPARERLFSDERHAVDNRELFGLLAGGKRYSNLRLNYYVNMIEKKEESQFSAITYMTENGIYYIAFRGTDETIVGWKEDFNMAFISPVPGQYYSARYINEAAKRFDGRFYVGGHSKGGNLAVYAAMNCNRAVQDRIIRIYDMDGPGFRPAVLEKDGYGEVEERVSKFIPHSSLVGILLEWNMHFEVVASKNFGLLQHDPYSWLFDGTRLVRVDDIYEKRRMMGNALNEWILSLDEKQLRTFTETLFAVIGASEAEDINELTLEWKKSIYMSIAVMREIDEETRDILKEMFKSLLEIVGEHVKQEVADGLKQIRRKKS